MKENNVPQWILNSSTGIEKQNDEVGLIVAKFIGSFRKRGFEEKEIGIMMAQAFLLPLEEVERRVDAILSCGDNIEECKRLCLYTAQEGYLFDNNKSDPCGVVELLKAMYGKEFAFEAILSYPSVLSLYKEKSVRDSQEYLKEKAELNNLLDEFERVYKS